MEDIYTIIIYTSTKKLVTIAVENTDTFRGLLVVDMYMVRAHVLKFVIKVLAKLPRKMAIFY